MKKITVFLGLAAAVAVLVAGLATSNASAQGGAIVINDAGCGLLDGDGGFVLASSDHAVVTPSGNGTLVCKVKGVANSSGKAVHYDFDSTGIACGTAAGVTTNWHETVSASGNATLVCHVP